MADSSAPPLLDIRNATIWRGTTRVFENLNLRIAQGECVAILGANGAGKTTLLKTLNRELYPVRTTDSFVKVLGKERWNVWMLRRHIGVVSNDLHLRYPSETDVLSVVVSGFHSSIGVHGNVQQSLTNEQLELAQAALARSGLLAHQSKSLRDLSTGQQRRVLLARALVHQPRTLILDEPTSGLDLTASFSHMNDISELARSGSNIVLVTHKIGEIPPPVSRVIVLKAGTIIADGHKADVLTASILSDAFSTPVRIATASGYFLPYPG